MVRELYRKGFHLVFGGFCLFCAYFIHERFGLQALLFSALALLFVFMLFDWSRLDLKSKYLSILVRKKEYNRPVGATFMVISAIICFALYDFDIAIAALAMCIVGDATAALVGKNVPSQRIFGKKTLLGTLAAAVINFIVAYFLLDGYLLVAVVSISAALVELITDRMEDNLAIPLVSGFLGMLIRSL